MTAETKRVFDEYEIRKTKKQKEAFRGFVKEIAEKNGYEYKVEKGSFGVRNIVVGDVDRASVVFTAHYDTCAVLPFPNFITPKNFFIYLLYQLWIVIPILLAEFLIGVLTGIAAGLISAALSISVPIGEISVLISYIFLFILLYFLIAGPANKHTANDNTSGVTVLIDTMTAMPEDLKGKAAFVFFDLEEAGLFGSSAFASGHKKTMKNKLLINFDCVSDGYNVIFALRKGAKNYASIIEESYPQNESFKVEVSSKGIFYPSDQINFNAGVGVATLKKSKKLGILYMDRIHTKKDTVYQEENIEFFKNGSIKLTERI